MQRRAASRLLLRIVVAIGGAPLMIGAMSPDSGFETRILAAHNLERARMGTPPLRWNADLAVAAKRWAVRLAASGAFEHAPERTFDPQGENLWEGSRGYFTLEAMVDAWVREKRHFKSGTFPNNSTTGRVEDIGHYTQLIWRETRQVGCATAANADNEVLVCRYSEAGNYLGERAI